MAFAAVDEVWDQRTEQPDAASVVEEVSDAAAQVDPVNALKRAQQLRDPAAQAIGMLTVARVVLARQDTNAISAARGNQQAGEQPPPAAQPKATQPRPKKRSPAAR